MSQKLEEVFKRVQARKKEQREIRKTYKDALSVNGEYQEVLQELEALKIKKKKIEDSVKSDFKEEFDKLESLKLDITSDNQMLSDIALTELVSGHTVEVVDDNKVEYDPQFTVKFKKK